MMDLRFQGSRGPNKTKVLRVFCKIVVVQKCFKHVSTSDPTMNPKWPNNDPKVIPRWPQVTPEWHQSDPKVSLKWSQSDPNVNLKLPQTLPNKPPHYAKSVLRWILKIRSALDSENPFCDGFCKTRFALKSDKLVLRIRCAFNSQKNGKANPSQNQIHR